MHTRLLLGAFLIAAHTLLSGAISLDEQDAEPSLSPAGEQVVNDPDIAADCLAHARDVGSRLDSEPDTGGYFKWTLGAAVVTYNEHWGLVCRIDFTMAGEDVSPRVNRLVVYAASEQLSVIIAIGENIAPLEPDAGTALTH
jgi:hypothetical protein